MFSTAVFILFSCALFALTKLNNGEQQAPGKQQVVHTTLPHNHDPGDGGLGVKDAS